MMEQLADLVFVQHKKITSVEMLNNYFTLSGNANAYKNLVLD